MQSVREVVSYPEEQVMTYYYVEESGIIAKGGTGFSSNKYIYDCDEGWVFDKWSIINDYLAGLDKSEEEDSPYRFGNSGIMDGISKISEHKAQIIIQNDYKFRLGDKPERWNP